MREVDSRHVHGDEDADFHAGGIDVFGLNGFVIGPLIAAMFMVSWEIFSASRRMPRDGA